MLGLLWMDDSDVKLSKKITEAAQAYRARFGAPATLCYASAADVSETITLGGVVVEPRGNILRHHFLVGQATSDAAQREKAA